MFYKCTKSVSSSYSRNAFTHQQGNIRFLGQKQAEKSSILYIQILFISMVWADLPHPVGECALAWGKLAHLGSIQNPSIYKGFSSVYIYIWPYVNFYINNILGSSMSNFLQCFKFWRTNLPQSPLPVARSDTKYKMVLLSFHVYSYTHIFKT